MLAIPRVTPIRRNHGIKLRKRTKSSPLCPLVIFFESSTASFQVNSLFSAIMKFANITPRK